MRGQGGNVSEASTCLRLLARVGQHYGGTSGMVDVERRGSASRVAAHSLKIGPGKREKGAREPGDNAERVRERDERE